MVNLQMPIFPHRERRAGQTVPRLPETAGIDDMRLADAPYAGDVRVSKQNHVRVDAFQFRAQRIFGCSDEIERALEWLARRAVREKEPRAIEFNLCGRRQCAQVRQRVGFELAQSVLARGDGEVAVFRRRREIAAVRGGMVVVAAHRVRDVRAQPRKARGRIGSVAHRVAKKEERVRRLFDRVQRGERFEVCVEVGEDDNSQ